MKPIVVAQPLHKALFLLAAVLAIAFFVVIVIFEWYGKTTPPEIKIAFASTVAYLFGAPLVPERRTDGARKGDSPTQGKHKRVTKRPSSTLLPSPPTVPLQTPSADPHGGDTQRGDGNGGTYNVQ